MRLGGNGHVAADQGPIAQPVRADGRAHGTKIGVCQLRHVVHRQHAAADLVFRALRWQILIRPICRVPLRRLSAYMLVGYLANNVLPARLGELVRSHYLGDREGISRSATLGTVVVERIVDTVVLVAIGAFAILILNVRGVVVSAILVGVAISALLCVALAVALAAHRLPGAARAAAFLGRWPRVVGVATRLRDGLRVAARCPDVRRR